MSGLQPCWILEARLGRYSRLSQRQKDSDVSQTDAFPARRSSPGQGLHCFYPITRVSTLPILLFLRSYICPKIHKSWIRTRGEQGLWGLFHPTWENRADKWPHKTVLETQVSYLRPMSDSHSLCYSLTPWHFYVLYRGIGGSQLLEMGRIPLLKFFCVAENMYCHHLGYYTRVNLKKCTWSIIRIFGNRRPRLEFSVLAENLHLFETQFPHLPSQTDFPRWLRWSSFQILLVVVSMAAWGSPPLLRIFQTHLTPCKVCQGRRY